MYLQAFIRFCCIWNYPEPHGQCSNAQVTSEERVQFLQALFMTAGDVGHDLYLEGSLTSAITLALLSDSTLRSWAGRSQSTEFRSTLLCMAGLLR